MSKKSRTRSQKTHNSNYNGQASELMTEQQQKMMYLTKNRTYLEDSRQTGTIKKTSHKPIQNDDEDQEQIQQIELQNLNHTSAEEITNFINKLIAKNKISSKNAFDIPLIHLEQMEDFRASLNDNTWKRLSSTLQNDYKIYGYRVDAAHTITYKMVESIARHEATAQENIDQAPNFSQKQGIKKAPKNDLMDSFIENEWSENVNKNKLNVDYARHIEKNQKLLNIGHLESFFGYNPGLQRTKRKFDQQGFKSLLLNNIELRQGGELKLDEHYRKENEDRPKEQMEDDNMREPDRMNQDQFDQMMTKIWQKNENSIMTESQQQAESVFTKIYELNIVEGKAQEDFAEMERLYRIVSKEEKEEKKTKKKQQQVLVQESRLNESKNVEKVQNVSNPEVLFNEPADCMVKNEVPEPIIEEGNENNPQSEHEEQNFENSQNQNLPSDNQRTNEAVQAAKIAQVNQQNDESVLNQPQQSTPLPKQETQNALTNKNFEIKQINLENLDQDSQSSSSYHPQKIQYTGKLKNIEQYINIKESTRKNKKSNLSIEQLDPQKIGKILFNKKTPKKKPTKIAKLQNPENQSTEQKTKKIDFSKIKQQNYELKKSTILKKSLAEERIFNQKRQKIKEKLRQKDKQKNAFKQTQSEKKKKGKRFSRLFDLPIYQFEQGDTNYVKPIQEFDPQTSQIQFSNLFKYHFPSFVFSSNQIFNESEKKKVQKEILRKQKQFEQKKLLEQNQQDMSRIIQQQHNQEQKELQNRIQDQNVMEYSDNISPDISFIQNEMGQAKGNQVVIREAKEKVRKIMLSMFGEIEAKRKKSLQKNKLKKLTYKKIYQAYYRQNGYISPALCFLTVLHLANEHNLSLEGKQDGSDFKIWVDQEQKICQDFATQEEVNSQKMDVEYSFHSRESQNSSIKTQNVLKDLERLSQD